MENIIWSNGHSLLIQDIVRAENCYLFDAGGKRYTDMESGVWCTGIGHCHPVINGTICDQAGRIYQSGFNYISPIVESAAKRVLEITGFPGGRCVFLCSGSESVEFGVRISAAVAAKPLKFTFSDSYFGAYGQATQKKDQAWIRYNWLECSCSGPEGCNGTCGEFNAIPFREIGLFLFEPGSSSGLVHFPSVGLVERVDARVRENGGLVMVNEVTTGAGRTGRWFGFQHYGIRPDIIAMGKGIGNGYPVSVTAVTKQVVGLLDPAGGLDRPRLLYAQSHQNDPLGASVVLAVIDTIEKDGLIDIGRKLSERLLAGLDNLHKEFPVIREIRGRGLMIAIELVRGAEQVQAELLQKGYIVARRPGHEVLRLDPPLTIPDEEIEAFLEALGEVLGQTS